MLKSVENISATKKRLMIEIPTEAIEKKIKDSLEKMRQKAKIPGFRPGKTPMNIIEKHFGKNAEAEAIENIIPEFYEKALKEADIVPVSKPVLDSGINFQRNAPLSLALIVEIRPKLDKLNYEKISVKDIPVAVSDSDVDISLSRLQEGKATFELADKEIAASDLVTVDYDISHDGQTMSAKDQALQIGAGGLPAEISESLIGKKAGDTVEVETRFPENFHVKTLAGKTAMVKNTIKAVKKKNLPAIDDELAKDLGFENIAGLREGVSKEIEKAKKEQAVKVQKDELLEKLINAHDFDVPDSLLEKELSEIIRELKAAGKAADKDDAALQAEFRPEAVKTAKALILLSIIGEKEGITVTDDELKEKFLEFSQKLSIPPESLMKLYIQRDGSFEGFRYSIYSQKVLDLLLSRAVVEKGEKA